MVVEARLPSPDGEAPQDHYVHFYSVAWADYQKMREIRGERRRPKIAYLKGTLELVTTSRKHQRIKSWIGRLVEAWCLEHDVEFEPYGEWTLEDDAEEVAAEPDECYIFGADQEGKDRPDLVIEVVLTAGGIRKLDIYDALCIREVWFWKKDRIEVHARRDTGYERIAASEVLPGLDLDELLSFLDRPTASRAIRDYQGALRQKGIRAESPETEDDPPLRGDR